MLHLVNDRTVHVGLDTELFIDDVIAEMSGIQKVLATETLLANFTKPMITGEW